MVKYIVSVLFIWHAGLSVAQLPSSLDLRTYNGKNVVSSVKTEHSGTSWTHSTMASVESNLMMTDYWTANGETGEPDLAEYHLDWWNGFNQSNNDDLGGINTQGLIVHQSGNFQISTAYFSRLEGAVRNTDGQSFDIPPDRYNVNFRYYYPRHVEWYTAGENLLTIDTIKTKLIQYGAMASCIRFDAAFMDVNYNHYQPPTDTYLPNHSVTIIGWDDNHNVPAAGQNGAWLAKNSWGEAWGNSGYFWISYYDKWTCKEPDLGAVSFFDIEPLRYDIVYFYDYHGRQDTKANTDSAFNTFRAKEDVVLKSVSFFTETEDVIFTIKVFKTFENGSLSGLQSTKTGNILHRGFHTIDLDNDVAINNGENFYIFLYLNKGGQAYDRTSNLSVLLGNKTKTLVPSAANPQESYYYENGVWKDLYNYNDPSGFSQTGNFCIKGLAVYNTAGMKQTENNNFNVFPNPANNQIQIKESSGQNISYRICNINGKLLNSGTIKNNPTIDVSYLKPGLYFLELNANNKLTVKKIIIK